MIGDMHVHLWSSLTKPQLGRYAEYFIKMEFTLHGLDVYTSEVDDKGIDFVMRTSANRHYDVQVKSVRNQGLICLPRKVFEPRENLLLAAVNFSDGKPPEPFLIPSLAWIERPSKLLVHYILPDKFDEYQLRMAGHDEMVKAYSFASALDDLAAKDSAETT